MSPGAMGTGGATCSPSIPEAPGGRGDVRHCWSQLGRAHWLLVRPGAGVEAGRPSGPWSGPESKVALPGRGVQGSVFKAGSTDVLVGGGHGEGQAGRCGPGLGTSSLGELRGGSLAGAHWGQPWLCVGDGTVAVRSWRRSTLVQAGAPCPSWASWPRSPVAQAAVSAVASSWMADSDRRQLLGLTSDRVFKARDMTGDQGDRGPARGDAHCMIMCRECSPGAVPAGPRVCLE